MIAVSEFIGVVFWFVLVVACVLAGLACFYALRLRRKLGERQAIEKKLRINQREYRAILDSVNIGITLLDTNMQVLSTNRQMHQWFPDVPFSTKPICFAAYNDPPLDNPCSYCPVVETYRDGKVHESVKTIPGKGGKETRNFRIISSPITDSGGKLLGAIELTEDITHRMRVEQDLQQTTSKAHELEDIIKHSAAIAWLWDITREGWPVEFVSDNVSQFGYTAEDFISQRVLYTNLVHEDDLEKLAAETRQYLRDGVQEFCHQYRIRTKAGEVRWVEDHTWLRYNSAGEATHMQGILIDITQRKLAEQDLQQTTSKARELEDIINRSAAIAWLWNITQEGWPVDFVSDNVSQFGYTTEDFTSKRVLFADIVHEDDLKELAIETKQYLQDGVQEFYQHYRIRTKAGEVRWVEDHTWRRHNSADKETHVQGVLIDITQRKLAEQARQELESRVQQTQKIESLRVLAGGIAHDFNNLLMIITGNADLGLMDVTPDSPIGELLREIKDAAVRASKLSNQMRAYSGQGHVGMDRVVLNDLVAEMLRLMKSSIPPKVRLEYDFATRLPAVEADASQLEQVVMNLIVNAYESIGSGEGTIRVRTCAIDVTREYLLGAHMDEPLTPGRYVLLEVQDTGSGMDAETSKRIFDPFFTTKFIGRGLGLAAVLGIVRGHRGAIRVTSKPGKGSTFQVLLPPAEPSLPPSNGQAQPAEEPAGQWIGQGTVLVIDDEKAFLNVASIILKRSGFEVFTAETGQAALEYFREHHEQTVAVLLDMSMPGMSGEETFAGLQQIDPNATIFLCSGFAESEAVKHFSGKGLAGFLQKPFQINTLLAALRKVVDGKTVKSQ